VVVPLARDRQRRRRALPVLDTVPEEARRRGVELVVVPTVEAIEFLRSEVQRPTRSCT
jgi:hypothetical protein